MRLMTNEELVAVSGGEGQIYDPFNQDSDWDFVSWANDFGLFDLEFGNGKAKGKKDVPDNEMDKVMERLTQSLPEGKAELVAKAKGNKDGLQSWEVTITITIDNRKKK